MRLIVHTAVTVLCLCVSVVYQDNLQDVLQTLHHHLLHNYTTSMKAIPPYPTKTNQFNLTLRFKPLAILNLDEARQILTFTSYTHVEWTDLNLRWLPHQFANQTGFHLPREHVWTPNILLSNSADDISIVGGSSVYIYTAGTVMMESFQIFRTTCDINVRNYPFDEQRCKVTFTPEYGYNFNVIPYVIALPLEEYFSVHGEWNLMGVTASTTEIQIQGVEHTYAGFTLVLKRYSNFYVISVIFPMALLSVMTSLVFLLPPDSGEKISYLISIFVSYAVFLNYVNDVMPKTSISNLSVYLCLVLVQSCFAVMATLFVLHRHHSKLLSSVHPLSQKKPESRTQQQEAESKPVKKRVLKLLCYMYPALTLDQKFFVVFFLLAICSVSVLFL